MNRVIRLLSLCLAMTFVVTGCVATAAPTLTVDQQIAVYQTLTAMVPATPTTAATATLTPTTANTPPPTPAPTPSVIGPDEFG